MRPAKSKLKRFRLDPKYVHHRSEGLTRRQNRGTKLLVLEAPEVTMNAPTPLHERSAASLARMVRAREVSAVEVVRAHLDRIEELNPVLNTVIQIAPDSALAQAHAADQAVARGDAVEPLHGVPFTVKDVYDVRDCATLVAAPGMAPRLEQHPRPVRDSTVVTRLRAAGAILVGVTKATLWTDREEHYGTSHNPYDLARTPGGSSGGEAATIAAGGSPLGMGSDSGGSLRWPAHFCGVATIRPSNGRVPRGTDADGMYDPRTAAGPLARSVEDVALALGVVSGFDPEDPTTIPLAGKGFASKGSMGYGLELLAGSRVAVHDDNGIVAPTAATAATIRAAAAALADAGAIVEVVTPPGLSEAWEITLEYWRRCGGDGALRDWFGLLDRWQGYQRTASRFLRDHDLILCPTEAFPATRNDVDDQPATFTYTAPASLLGWPAAVVRAGTSPEGLPIGAQVVAGPLRDDLALAAAAAIEAVSGGWRPPPPPPPG